MKDEGVCYHNTTVVPSVAEALACIEATYRLLNDDSDSMLGDSG